MEQALPFSQACENNKQPILDVLQRHLRDELSLLEIAGGTGQHAVFFAENLPHVHWQSSDIPDNVDTLNLRIIQAGLSNLPLALPLDVNVFPWGAAKAGAIFSANCLHIISEESVRSFFSGVGECLTNGGLLLVYGPFKYGGEFTTESNANFDRWLKSRDPESGVRDFEWVDELATSKGLKLIQDYSMPANNQLLVWQQSTDNSNFAENL